ncbi:MAG: hypothetical protein NTY53_17530 [Kiritimatiellaeota bacterium]|nr:hypothetical protein [Kiritimatiellota bacterium]
MINARSEFEAELETFRKEVDTASQLLYAQFTVHNVVGKKPNILKILNQYSYFWATTLYALQCSGFITLGRIFDQKSPHNVDTVLRLAQRHAALFTKAELSNRKREGSANADEWLPAYMTNVYEPTPTDFRRLRKAVAAKRAIYQASYDRIRNGVFAHTEVTDPNAVAELFSMVNTRTFQQLLVFLNRLHETLWQLYHNGRKPVLKPMPYSAGRMVKTHMKTWQRRTIQQLVVKDTQEFLESIERPSAAKKETVPALQP